MTTGITKIPVAQDTTLNPFPDENEADFGIEGSFDGTVAFSADTRETNPAPGNFTWMSQMGYPEAWLYRENEAVQEILITASSSLKLSLFNG